MRKKMIIVAALALILALAFAALPNVPGDAGEEQAALGAEPAIPDADYEFTITADTGSNFKAVGYKAGDPTPINVSPRSIQGVADFIWSYVDIGVDVVKLTFGNGETIELGNDSIQLYDNIFVIAGKVSARNVFVLNDGDFNGASLYVTSGTTIAGTTTAGITNNGTGNVNVFGGTISATNGSAITNNSAGTVNIYGGTVSVGNGYGIESTSTGTVNIYGGTLVSTSGGTLIKAAGNVNVYGGMIDAKANGATGIEYRGNVTVTGGTIDANGSISTAIYCASDTAAGAVTISGGTIKGGRVIETYSNGNITISDGSLTGTSVVIMSYSRTAAVNVSGGTITCTSNNEAIKSLGPVTVSGGTVSSSQLYAITVWANVTISGGTVSSSNLHAIMNSSPTSTVTVTGGTVISTHATYGAIYSMGPVVISEASASVPTVVTSRNSSATGGTITMHNDIPSVTVSGGTVNNTSTGTYRNVIYPDNVSVTVTSVPAFVSKSADISKEADGISETLSAVFSSLGIVTDVQWYRDNAPVSGAKSMTYDVSTAAQSGAYELRITYMKTGGTTDVISSGTINVNITSPGPAVYSVSVSGGTASLASGTAGTQVTLTPSAAPAGKVFRQWSITSGTGASVTGNTLTIGTSNVSVVALWDDITYTVTVSGGTASPASGTMGTPVTLTYGIAPLNKQFKQWNVISGGVTVTGNSLIIGTSNIVVEAEWKDVIFSVTVIGGTASPSSGIAGTSVTLTPDTTEAGKKLRWEINFGNGSIVGDTLTIGTSNMIVEAVWETEYEFIEAPASEWVKGSADGLTMKVDAPFANFVEVKVDGTTIADTNYTLAEGSTIVTLKASYLETLAAGTHAIDVVFSDGSASACVTVTSASATGGNAGGDGGSNTWLYAGIAIGVVIAFVAVYFFIVKKK